MSRVEVTKILCLKHTSI